MSVGAERGSLPLALMVTILVTGLVSVVTASVVMGQQQTRFDESYERSLQLAEAGADRALEAVAEGSDLVTDEDPGEDPRAWAVDRAREAIDSGEDDPALRALDDGGGWAYGIRVTGEGGGSAAIYGVGISDRGDRSVERVVRLGLDDHASFIDAGFVAGCPTAESAEEVALVARGTVEADGVVLHSNCSIVASGNVSGTYRAHGTVDYGGSDNASREEGKPVVELPDFSARDYYRANDDHAPWYDLCSDGTIKEPGEDDQGPCEGEKTDDLATRMIDGEWKIEDAGAVFYVDGADAEIATDGKLNVLVAERAGQGGDLSVSVPGSADVSRAEALHEDLPVVVDGALEFAGNNGLEAELFLIGGHVDIKGGATLTGSVIAAQRAGETSTLGGTANIKDAIDLDEDDHDTLRVSRWEEL